MRPTVDELLAGAQQTVEQVLLPDLRSSFGRSRARMVVRILDYVRRTLRGQEAFLAAEIDALSELLAGLRDLFLSLATHHPDLSAAREQAQTLDELLRDGAVRPESRLEPARLDEERDRLAAALDAVIRTLDRLEQERPEPRLAAARAQIRDYLKASLERELVLTGTRRETLAP